MDKVYLRTLENELFILKDRLEKINNASEKMLYAFGVELRKKTVGYAKALAIKKNMSFGQFIDYTLNEAIQNYINQGNSLEPVDYKFKLTNVGRRERRSASPEHTKIMKRIQLLTKVIAEFTE